MTDDVTPIPQKGANGQQPQLEAPVMQVDGDRILAVLDKVSEALLALAEQQKSLTLTLQAVAAAAQGTRESE